MVKNSDSQVSMGVPMDVKDHPDTNLPIVSTPQYRINSAFQALKDGDMDKVDINIRNKDLGR